MMFITNFRMLIVDNNQFVPVIGLMVELANTCASHAQDPQFDPGLDHDIFLE